MMNRRGFFGMVSNALATAALVAHLDFHSLVPVATLQETTPEIANFAAFRELIQGFKTRMGFYPRWVFVTREEWDHLTGVMPAYRAVEMSNYHRYWSTKALDIPYAAKAQCEASMNDFCIYSIDEVRGTYFPDDAIKVYRHGIAVSEDWPAVGIHELSEDQKKYWQKYEPESTLRLGERFGWS